MQDLYYLSLKLHNFFVVLFFIFNFIYIILVSRNTKNVNFQKNIRLFLPTYYTVLIFIIFTGSIILPIFHFKLNTSTILMILLSIYIVVINVVLYKNLKQKLYKKYQKLALILITSILISIILVGMYEIFL